jgi:exopolyphosphatase/guanosine-5'-triphosphate,3'-diphosphate pyrophosphatase
MPVYAVIDVGTNSVKFHVAERLADGSWRTLVDRAEVTRLGEGIAETGDIAPEAIARTVEAIAGMADEAKAHGGSALVAVGTMGMRSAQNSDEFIARVRERCGVTIEVIPGEEEGRLAYLAAKAGLGLADGSVVVFDTGGGSTQFTFGRGAAVDEQFSLNIGAVRLTTEFGLGGALAREQLDKALAAIAEEFDRLDGVPSPDALVGMGGAITNMTAVMLGLDPYDPEAVQGSVLGRAEVDRQIELLRTRDLEARRQIVGLQPKRADVILAGACVVRTVMDKLGRDALTVSDRGLRHGVLLERFGYDVMHPPKGDTR